MPTANAAQRPGTARANTHTYEDYLTTPGAATVPAGSQCSTPVVHRKGAWLCPIPSSATKPLAQTSGNWCDAAGCYYWVSNVETAFDSDAGTWGYGSRELGTEANDMTWTLNGTLITCKPFVYSNSADTNTVTMSGNLLNPAPKTPGSVISGTYEQYSFPGEVVGASWPSPGYQAADNQNYYHSAAMEVAWSMDGYPGYWYS